jgi:Icc-related predicted phosphoesterase
MTQVFFATDLHGSLVCFKKFIGAAKFYGADVLIMGGDCTGKMLVPLVERNGGYVANYMDREWVLASGDEVQDFERVVADAGYYTVRLDPERYAELRNDPEKLDEVFEATMIRVLEEWLEYGKSRLGGTGVKWFVTPGNDDHICIDDVIRRDDFAIFAEDEVVELDDGVEMLSVGWSNSTPWNTPREGDETVIAARIEALTGKIKNMDTAVFNLHAPPYGTGLDTAPELDDKGAPLRGGAVMMSVGSTAVRDAITKHQPLLGLHGHIHEARGTQKIGRTLCVNPGSNYGDASLNGVIVTLKKGKLKSHLMTMG